MSPRTIQTYLEAIARLDGFLVAHGLPPYQLQPTTLLAMFRGSGDPELIDLANALDAAN